MKYPPQAYAKALVEALGDTQAKSAENIEKNFLALVRRNGDEAHLKKILEEALRFARGKKGVRKVVIESARILAPSQKNMMKQLMKPGDVIEEKIDPELIAGIRITLDDELQFDGSLRNKLNKILPTG